ncbi:hypothetical protein [Alloactinosynnema sp. L-07]|nr:hypothetical protein [Alloactinosynnema sp. L-07]
MRGEHPCGRRGHGKRQLGGQVGVREPTHSIGTEQPCHGGPPLRWGRREA